MFASRLLFTLDAIPTISRERAYYCTTSNLPQPVHFQCAEYYRKQPNCDGLCLLPLNVERHLRPTLARGQSSSTWPAATERSRGCVLACIASVTVTPTQMCYTAGFGGIGCDAVRTSARDHVATTGPLDCCSGRAGRRREEAGCNCEHAVSVPRDTSSV